MDSRNIHMDRDEVMDKFERLKEMYDTDYLLESMLRAMSTDEAQQQLEWFCTDNDVEIDEI